MASFSNTRNKIQAILSSFMHEKDEFTKERNSNHDVAENPGLLSMLCQPRNRENFYERVETFSHCALYGWENTDVDLLTCVSCKAILDGMIGAEWDTDTYKSTCAKLRSSIVNGHSKFCPWKETPCPESFLSLPAKTSQEWKASFESACGNLLLLQADLPVLKREAFQELAITEDVLSTLSNYITESEISSNHQDIIDTVCVLALCGWNTSNETDSSSTLCCNACHREAGLWNFHSLRNVTLIHNDAGQQQDGEGVEGVTRDYDGQCRPQVVMEEDIPDFGADALVNVGTTVQQDMVCDVEMMRDEDGSNSEQLSSTHECIDHEYTSAQVVTVENDQEISGDTECESNSASDTSYEFISMDTLAEHRRTEDNINENNSTLGDNEESYKPDLELTLSPESESGAEIKIASEVQNTVEEISISNARNISEFQVTSKEAGTPDTIEVSKLSPLHEQAQRVDQISNFPPERMDNNGRQISEAQVESAIELVHNVGKCETQQLENKSLEENPCIKENLPAQQNPTLRPLLPEQCTPQSDDCALLPKQDIELPLQEPLQASGDETLPEQVSLKEEKAIPGATPESDEKSVVWEEHVVGERLAEETLEREEHVAREEHVSEEVHVADDRVAEERHVTREELRFEIETSRPERESPLERGSVQEEGPQRDYENLSHVEGELQESGGVREMEGTKELTIHHNLESSQGDCEPGSRMAIEPSKLFSTGFFSPAHSRQDSLIVEVGEDSMSERMWSIQSDLQDRGETASQMDSCRSVSDWSDGEVGEPSSKRLKTDHIEKIEFDVLAEHRNWCPWITIVPSARNTGEPIQKSPGWQIFLENLVQSTSPEKHVVKQTPPTQVWKSFRRLFYDCQTTIMRTTKSNVLEGKV